MMMKALKERLIWGRWRIEMVIDILKELLIWGRWMIERWWIDILKELLRWGRWMIEMVIAIGYWRRWIQIDCWWNEYY
jgi:hypothetical protein